MQLPPLTFADVSLLFAIGAISLSLILEFSSARYGITNVMVNKEALRAIRLILTIVFLITIILRAVIIVLVP